MKRAELIASIATLAVGVPAVYLLSMAVLDGTARANEAPLRFMLGQQAYEALRSGRTGETVAHYIGNDRIAPDFTLRDKDGRAWTLSEHRGKVVVLNFWTLHCQPCVEELPALDSLARSIAEGGDDIELVSVTTDSGWDAVAPIVPPHSQLNILFDPTRAVVGGKFGTSLFPETWIIDPDGVIRVRIDGSRDWSSPEARDLIESFL